MQLYMVHIYMCICIKCTNTNTCMFVRMYDHVFVYAGHVIHICANMCISLRYNCSQSRPVDQLFAITEFFSHKVP